MANFCWISNVIKTQSKSSTRQSKLKSQSRCLFLIDTKPSIQTQITTYRNPQNVLPLVNKGLTLFQMDQNIGAAERCCNEALRIDPECEAAVATLAQLSLQQGLVDTAIKYFEKSAELARTEQELAGALTYQYVS